MKKYTQQINAAKNKNKLDLILLYSLLNFHSNMVGARRTQDLEKKKEYIN